MEEIRVDDIVRIGKLDGKYNLDLNPSMMCCVGRIGIIRSIESSGYCISIDGSSHKWEKSMFNLHISNPKEYSIVSKRRQGENQILYNIYYKKNISGLNFYKEGFGNKWVAGTSCNIDRRLALKIESILRGLDSNG